MNSLDTEAFEALLVRRRTDPLPRRHQPHGVLVTLSEPALCIEQISNNVQDLFGLNPHALLGQPLSMLTGPTAAAACAGRRVRRARGRAAAGAGHARGCVRRLTAKAACWCLSWNSSPTRYKSKARWTKCAT